MARFLLVFLLSLVFGGLVAAQPSKGGGTIAPPRIAYRKRVLANGLTVFSVANHRTPTVAIQVWYRVGSKDDPEGRSGFAHLFEHLMFKATAHMPSEEMDRLTEDVGGENNAFTAEDMTVYHEVVPSQYLESLLWAEADRMATLAVNETNFHSERAVVEEEYRQSVLAPPYGRLGVLTNERSFTVHPYKRDTIGSIPDLESASLEDVQKFHSTFYRPDNATLIVVGDFTDSELDAWVDKYFAPIARPEGDIPRVTTREPARTAEKRYSETAPNVPLPSLVVTYLTPPRNDPDADALRLADTLLSSGESSRLYRTLVYEQQVASDVNSSADLRGDAGLFTLNVTAAGGKTLDQVEKAVFAQVERLKTAPIPAAELQKARNILLAQALGQRQTNEEIGFALGNAILVGDPERVNTDIARLQAVTAADIQRVARKYFTTENRVVLRYAKGPEEAEFAASMKAVGAASSGETPSGEAIKVEPPAPTKPRPAVFPVPVEKRLANGLRVVVIPVPGTGLVSGELLVRTGGASDPKDRAGLADFTASLLTRGTATRTAPQIAEEIEALGGSLGASAGWDGSFVSLSVLKTNLAPAMGLFSQVVREPAFAPAEIERRRSEELDDLEVRLQSPGTLASLVAARVAYGDFPYAHALSGTPESLRALTRADMLAFHARYYRPENAVLVLGGDLTPAEGFAAAQKTFGAWVGKPQKRGTLPRLPPLPRGGRVVVVDKPDAGQAAVYLIRLGLTRSDPAYYRAEVASMVYGSGYSSRLNQEIRIKRGLSYGAFGSLGFRLLTGPLIASAQTKNESAPEVAGLLQEELARLATGDLPPTELTPRKAALVGEYARGLETAGGLVSEVASLALYERPLSDLTGYIPGVEAVTAEQVKTFAAKRLPPADASLVIVGDARKFLPALREKYKNIEVISAAKLDLNHAKLIKP